MAVIPYALFLLIILGVIIGLIVVSIRSGVSGVKLMLLGINSTLFGGIIAVDSNSNLAGIEYLIVLTGLIISIVASRKKD
ncbi:hypothetical protein [Orenia marismortui]|uniref:hypothetical protein n=1 Tax=Orenia marismortui TaxID=46469 RepID=UPI00037BF09D|nr:hypothetical protein [Orenia marismortui]